MANDLDDSSMNNEAVSRTVAGADQSFDEDPLHATALRYQAEFPWADAGAIEINLAIYRTPRVLAAAQNRYLESLGMDISRARYTVLRTLYFANDNHLPQNEIGKEMGVSKTNITNLVDALEKDGLVTRVTNPADRRVTYAQLTTEGREFCDSVLPAMTRFMAEVCTGFTAEEKALFKQFLSRLWRAAASRYLQAAAETPD